MSIANGTLLAEDAQDATRPAGPCGICRRGILTGERFARLLSGNRLAHLSCVNRAALRRQPAAVGRPA